MEAAASLGRRFLATVSSTHTYSRTSREPTLKRDAQGCGRRRLAGPSQSVTCYLMVYPSDPWPGEPLPVPPDQSGSLPPSLQLGPAVGGNDITTAGRRTRCQSGSSRHSPTSPPCGDTAARSNCWQRIRSPWSGQAGPAGRSATTTLGPPVRERGVWQAVRRAPCDRQEAPRRVGERVGKDRRRPGG